VKKSNFFETHIQFFLMELHPNNARLAEEYCWAMVQAAGWAWYNESGSSVIESGFQLDPLLYTHVVDRLYSPF
jgi:hypothetical protein